MSDARIEKIAVRAYRVPTDRPESDGTFEWESTTLVVVHAYGGGAWGLGFTYADLATATLIDRTLAAVVCGGDLLSPSAAWLAMVHAIRNLGRPGIASMAISAIDNALWDLKARYLDQSVAQLLGAARPSVPAYGSGGFTSYTVDELSEQLGGWAADGFTMVKMKVGRDAHADVERVRAARAAIGPQVELFVDANGAYGRTQALAQAERFAEHGVTWFEEPRPSDDLVGLRLIRDRAPAGMVIAAGEYGYEPSYFDRMVGAGAVDTLQADATRCEGITGLLVVGALCETRGIPLSAHCAPSLHVHPFCALGSAVHVEYFHDHARIEQLLFDGSATAVRGALVPDLSRPGFGLSLKAGDAERYAIA
ncbi:MAG: mandelate racemase [Chloroflexota bacterium]|nr:mandelate racemase [Chloroflexota bacterium]